MSTTYPRRPHREATFADGARAAGPAGDAGQAGHAIACLDVLAAQMHARGWTASINIPAGRLAYLCVQDPHNRADCRDVMATPDRTTGDWWYWFSYAERIGPVHAPTAAADAIIRAFQRPQTLP